MPDSLMRYRIFLASPSGLEKERQAFRDVVLEYNQSEAVCRGICFESVGWELTCPGRERPQRLINGDIETCDYMILLLWDRWGSPPDTDGEYSSGVEEELAVAQRCLDDADKPMRDICVYFKAVNPRQLSDPGAQLQRVLKFRKKLETDKTHTFVTFDGLEVFKQYIRGLLAKWKRDHEDGQTGHRAEPGPSDQPSPEEMLPPPAAISADLPASVSAVLEQANELVKQGNLTEAESLYARLVCEKSPIHALSEYGLFMIHVGRYTHAVDLFQQALRLAELTDNRRAKVRAMTHLGLAIYQLGNFDTAIQWYHRSLAIAQQIGWLDGQSANYGNLGIVHSKRGKMSEAEEMFKRALAIHKQLRQPKGIALAYSHMGTLFKTQGRSEDARTAYDNAVAILQQVDDPDTQARILGHRGVLYFEESETNPPEKDDLLDRAEEMHLKALRIHEELGAPPAIAIDCANLGDVYRLKGELEKAEEYFRRALKIDEQSSRPEGAAIRYGKLGVVLMFRGKLDEAEQMHLRALEIDRGLDHKEGIAADYAHLSQVYERRGDFPRAIELIVKAKRAYEVAGIPPKVREAEERLTRLTNGHP